MKADFTAVVGESGADDGEAQADTAGVATARANRILTPQMAMPRDICSTVYSGATGYSASVTNLASVTTANDNVFGDNTAAQIAAQTPTLSGSISAGYTGSIVIGVPA